MVNIKKTISWSCILIATIVLLAHVVIPHHHHVCQPEGAVCFELNEHPHTSFAHNTLHLDIGGNDSEVMNHSCLKGCSVNLSCLLSRILSSSNHISIENVEIAFVDYLTLNADADGVKFSFQPYQYFYRTYCPIQSVGLRAPPTC